jgi:hypothetical protein
MYQSAPPMPDAEGINFMIQEAKSLKRVIPKESSLFWFVKTQMRFIDIKVWIFQILLLCVYTFFVCFTLQDTEGFLLLVPITPILVFIGTSELSRSFRYRMAEMEIPTRFSLRQVLLARLIIIVAADLFTLTCLMIITALQAYTAINALILYGIVPCLVTAYGCLWIMNRCNSSYSQYYTAAYCIALSVVGGISINLWPVWYNASAQGIWLLVFCIALAGVYSEVCKMLRNCFQKLEGFI